MTDSVGIFQKTFVLICFIVITGSVSKIEASCLLERNQTPWENPCMSDNHDHIWQSRNDIEWLLRFIIVLREMNQNIIQLKAQYYFNSTIFTLISKCGELDSDFFHLEGFPDPDESRMFIDTPDVNITTKILHDYKRLATVFVYIEQIVRDGDATGKDLEKLCFVYMKLQNALCHLQMQSDNVMLEKVTPTRSVMKREYRTINRMARINRNYIVFKDSGRYIEAIINKYVRIYINSKSTNV